MLGYYLKTYYTFLDIWLKYVKGCTVLKIISGFYKQKCLESLTWYELESSIDTKAMNTSTTPNTTTQTIPGRARIYRNHNSLYNKIVSAKHWGIRWAFKVSYTLHHP